MTKPLSAIAPSLSAGVPTVVDDLSMETDDVPQVLDVTRLKLPPATVPGSMSDLGRPWIERSGAQDIPELMRLVRDTMVAYDNAGHLSPPPQLPRWWPERPAGQAAMTFGWQISGLEWPGKRQAHPFRQLLASADVLLVMNGPRRFNPYTIRILPLGNFPQPHALIGHTVTYVKAGSLTSSYSDDAAGLKTLDKMLDQPPHHWPPELYPRDFKVQGKPQIARAPGMKLASDAELTRRLLAGEPHP